MKFDTDALDEYCRNTWGHTNWEFVAMNTDNIIVKFNKEPIDADGYDHST